MFRHLALFLLLFATSDVNETALRPQHAALQVVTNSCEQLTYLKLNGDVQKGDQGFMHVRWKTSCGVDCQPLGVPIDSLGNIYHPDESWGPAGIKFGETYNEMRTQTDADGSLAEGPVTIHLPMSCPIIAVYGVDAYFQNGTF